MQEKAGAATDKKQYTTERIVAERRTKKGEVEYEVKWEGYTDTTWEVESSFCGDGNMLELYTKKQAKKQKRKNRQTEPAREKEGQRRSSKRLKN